MVDEHPANDVAHLARLTLQVTRSILEGAGLAVVREPLGFQVTVDGVRKLATVEEEVLRIALGPAQGKLREWSAAEIFPATKHDISEGVRLVGGDVAAYILYGVDRLSDVTISPVAASASTDQTAAHKDIAARDRKYLARIKDRSFSITPAVFQALNDAGALVK
jgi:hypothetical protein